MATQNTTKKTEIRQKLQNNQYDVIYPKTSADIVNYSNTSDQSIQTVKDALDSIITNGVGVTSVGVQNGTNGGLSVSGSPVTSSGTITIGHSNSVTAGTIGSSSASSGASIAIPYATFDANGHITAKGTHTHTITASDLGLTSALKYIGTAGTIQPSAGSYIKTTIGSTIYYAIVSETGTNQEVNASKGDVIAINNKEYVCETAGTNGTNAFRELGDEGSYQLKVPALGSTTKPVYTSANGTFAECSTYAGGTKVTLNGTDKGANTASFYAPTGAGTSGQVLVSQGSGAPAWANNSISITANATDGMFDVIGTSGANAVTYAVDAYSSTTATELWVNDALSSAGKFYKGTQNPAQAERLNYNGYLYAKKLYSDGSQVLTTASANPTAGTYSVVSVNANGLVTGGAHAMMVVDSDDDVTNLAEGGVYFLEL